MLYTFEMLENEYWWGGTSYDGHLAPFDKNTELERDFFSWASNQTMPMYLSNKGRCIWCGDLFRVKISGGVFNIDADKAVIEKFGETLRDAYIGAMNKHFPPSGAPLERKFFEVPQYNTWMQLTYNQNQKDILKYAHEIIDNGFTPGVLMIDEGWQNFYGDWEFDRYKFPEPKAMIDELHELGFKVMLWVTPNVRPDGELFVRKTLKNFNPKEYDKIFLRNKEGKVAISHWWNGHSALLDLTKETDREFLDSQLKHLSEDYGVDGFKFDGGSVGQYGEELCINGPLSDNATQSERNIAWNDFGTRYPFHEYKDTFRGGGKRSIQRLNDKDHSWDNNGLNLIIPSALMAGLLGHPFICPDMIGGGSWAYRAEGKPVDEELFVRMAQCSALFPMMQFSWAPWEALSSENLQRVRETDRIHGKFSSVILELVDNAHEDGEPIMRTLEYNYPHMGYHDVTDTFMLGNKILVAPVITKGQTVRRVILPEGKWEGFDGKEYIGGKAVDIPVSLDILPYFIKK